MHSFQTNFLAMKAIIIEDQQNAHDYLKSMLEDMFPNIEIKAHSKNVKEAVKDITNYCPDIVFSDVRLGEELSFSAFEEVKHIDFNIIFTTAYDEFAVKAFKLSAIDYILKPVDPNELKIAIQKVFDKVELLNSKAVQSDKMSSLIQNIKNDQIGRIALRDQSGYKFVNINDIVRCEADDNYTKFIFCSGQPILVSKTIKEYENLLQESHFFRAHKTHLINIKQVKSYENNDNTAQMSDGSKIAVARRRKDEFLKLFLSLKK